MACVCRLLEETQPSAPWDAAILQREAIATLVDLVVRDQPNAACLLGLPITCQSIFTVCLPQCGDFGVQVLQKHPSIALRWKLFLWPLQVCLLSWVGVISPGMQVDIIDLLYRCAKHGTVPDTYLTAFSNKVRPTLRCRSQRLWRFS